MATEIQKKIPIIRAGIPVVDSRGHMMSVTAANQEKGEAYCVWKDQSGKTVGEIRKISELTPA